MSTHRKSMGRLKVVLAKKHRELQRILPSGRRVHLENQAIRLMLLINKREQQLGEKS